MPAPRSPPALHLLNAGLSIEFRCGGAWRLELHPLVLRPMLKGRRVTMSTCSLMLLATRLLKGFAAYVTSKYALQGLTRALASDIPPRLARISVSPGFLDTPLTSALDERRKPPFRLFEV